MEGENVEIDEALSQIQMVDEELIHTPLNHRGPNPYEKAFGNYLKMRRRLLEMRAKQMVSCDDSRALSFLDRPNRYCQTRIFLLEKRRSLVDLSATRNVYDTFSTAILPNTNENITWMESDKKKGADDNKAGSAYTFSGIHHMFVHHQKAVTVVRFANNNKDLAAFGSLDGVISICEVFYSPHLKLTMRGHTDGVTDLAWSASNEWLLSTSWDLTVRLWNTKNGQCIRIVKESAALSACVFYPFNTNIYFVTKRNGHMSMCNLSTGQPMKTMRLPYPITALSISTSGSLLFAGNDRGHITSFVVNEMDIKQMSTLKVADAKLTSIDYREWGLHGAREPELVVNACDGYLRLMSVFPKGGDVRMVVRVQIELPHKQYGIRTKYCPLLRAASAPCVVTGSESSAVLIYETDREGGRQINQLMGHGSCVIDVSWNYDESLLISSDVDGLVIVWKREKLVAVVPKNLDT